MIRIYPKLWDSDNIRIWIRTRTHIYLVRKKLDVTELTQMTQKECDLSRDTKSDVDILHAGQMPHDDIEGLHDVGRHDLTTAIQRLLQCIQTRLRDKLDSHLERAIAALAWQRHLQLNLCVISTQLTSASIFCKSHTTRSTNNYTIAANVVKAICLQCFDAVGWVAGRASGL